MSAPVFVAAATIASAATVVAQSAIQDGLDPTTGWAGGIVVAGIAVFLYMDRRAQREREIHVADRRKDDQHREQMLAKALADLEAERIAHRRSVEMLNERIVQLLSERD